MANIKNILRPAVRLMIEIISRPMLAVFLFFLFVFMGINAACAVIAGANPFQNSRSEL